MLVSTNILLEYGGIQKIYEKNEYIFHENDTARYFYQLIKGKVKVFCTNDEGKPFVQGFFSDGDSFGEPPFLLREKYPVSAIALSKSSIIKMNETCFEHLINDKAEIKNKLIHLLALRIYQKSVSSKDIVNQKTEHRILAFLQDYKKKKELGPEKYIIPFTRQEIADFTGLRVETVIRALSIMNKNNVVEILNRKLYF